MIDSRERALILAILAIGLALRVGFAWVLPPFQAPDEQAHFEYVRTLAFDRGLPVQPDLTPTQALAGWPQSYQPPLAYVLFAPAATVARALGAGPIAMLRTLRVQNALLGTLLVGVVFAIAAALRPAGDPLRTFAPWLVATWPGLAANAGSLNNDATAILLAAAFWWVWLRMPRGAARGVAVGGVLGAACLAKLTAATLAPLCLVLPCLECWRERRPLRQGVAECVVAAATALLLLFPWLLRNLSVYGDPLAIGAGSIPFDALRGSGLPPELVAQARRPDPAKALFQLFGRFGITNNLSFGVVSWAWVGLAVFASAGGIRGRTDRSLPTLPVIGFALAIALATLGLVSFSLRYYGAWQGRYLYVAIAPLSLLMGQGLLRSVPPERERAASFAIGTALALLGLALLVRLAFFFADAPRTEWGLRTLL